MGRKAKKVEGVEIVDLGAKGHVIGKKDGITYLCKGAVPGDLVDVIVRRKKKGMPYGDVEHIVRPSEDRVKAECQHYEFCGGCSWQNLDYAAQLRLKEKRVNDQIRRIGGLEGFAAHPIKAAPAIFEYRNKMEYTFIEQRWLTPEEITSQADIAERAAIGFHLPGRFDWVMEIRECLLQNKLHNEMRNFLSEASQRAGIPFFHPIEKTGIMRNVVFRNNRKGEWMAVLVTSADTKEVRKVLDQLSEAFPQIISLWLVINQKVNDSFDDCPATLVKGEPHLKEVFQRPDGKEVTYVIGPKSFFQTNSLQAERLYQMVYEAAALTGDECVYDLYTGAGSIALFVADKAKKVVGIEYVPEAIEDAGVNAKLNGIDNCRFYAGDMKDVLDNELIAREGRPDVVIADPPRAGMHADVVERILEMAPKRIVYVSCDPATQARDLKILSSSYRLLGIQPVDMFPHTSHVENIALLERS